MKFLLPHGKKFVKIKNSKILKNRKNGLEIWRIATVPLNLALLRSIVSEKTRFTDYDGRRTLAPQERIIKARTRRTAERKEGAEKKGKDKCGEWKKKKKGRTEDEKGKSKQVRCMICKYEATVNTAIHSRSSFMCV